MKPVISVVVTCYNHEQFIEECLRSLFAQTYPHIALYVYNDGSTDQSEHVILKVLEDSPFEETYYECHENCGLVKTRNKALDHIAGDFVLFVDSDDFLPTNFVEELVNTAVESDADIVYTCLKNPATQATVIDIHEYNLETLFVGNYISATSLIRRETIGEIRYDEYLNYKKLEDYDFYLNLILNKSAKPVPNYTTFLNYRILENSMSARNNLLKHYVAYVYILNKYQSLATTEVEHAVNIHFNQNLQRTFLAQKVTIYIGDEEGKFTEGNMLQFPLEELGNITFEIPATSSYIRIDLSEIPSFYEAVTLTEQESGQKLVPIFTNAIIFNQSYLFPNPDPQILYEISEDSERVYNLQYQAYKVESLHSEDYVIKILAQALLDSSSKAEEIEQCKLDFEQQKQQLEEITVQYNSVISSRRWTIPTKIINFFRRKQ
ncbi:glycosyltransferase family 2 protein [Streptococcus marmotae]|uniref:glycosyltransferase family 2 protein n=1 Tax=Streptococcus marmotae TaxID=1825069 RepID=UPI00082CAD5F|nr:glycosyltransferase family A protein [Streptococcus marmotae]